MVFRILLFIIPAPIATRYLNHTPDYLNYIKGTRVALLEIVSDKDWLTNLIKGYTNYTYFINEIVVHNGKSHDMAGFLTEQEQKL